MHAEGQDGSVDERHTSASIVKRIMVRGDDKGCLPSCNQCTEWSGTLRAEVQSRSPLSSRTCTSLQPLNNLYDACDAAGSDTETHTSTKLRVERKV